MGSLVLYAGAIALVGGLGTALTFVLGGRGQVSGVARSLALIEHNVSRREVAKNDLPASERLVKPLLESTRALAVRLSPSGTGERLVRQFVNGELVMEYTDLKRDPNEYRRFGNIAPGDAKVEPLDRGYISLQAESGPIEFRRIELMELTQ